MASLIGTWRRLFDIPERTEQSSRRAATNGRESEIQKKASAARAVERLAERKGSSRAEMQNPVYTEINVPEQENRLKDEEEDICSTQLQTEASMITSEEVKRIVEEALSQAKDTEEIKEYLAQRFSVIEGQILSVRNVQKQEMIAVSVREVQEKVDLIRLDTRRVGSIKVMLGISICFNLATLAVLMAYVLHFI